MMKKPLTSTERKRNERASKRMTGLVQVQLWIKPKYRERLFQYAEGLNKREN